MNTKIRYDLDSLELANGDFGYPITEKEVRKVNRMLELMENVRNRQMCSTEGDCVEFERYSVSMTWEKPPMIPPEVPGRRSISGT